MPATPQDVYDALHRIRVDCTAIQARVTDCMTMLNELNLVERPAAVCPACGLHLRGARTLAEHLYVSHDGPVPPHWITAAERADDRDPEPVATPGNVARPGNGAL